MKLLFTRMKFKADAFDFLSGDCKAASLKGRDKQCSTVARSRLLCALLLNK